MLDNANTLSRDNVLARNGNGDTGGLAYNAGRFLTRRHLMEFFIFMTVLILDILVGVFAASRGRSGIGFFLIALVLSPLIGFIIVLVIKPNAENIESQLIDNGELKRCPHCAELVKYRANVCKHCGNDLSRKRSIKEIDSKKINRDKIVDIDGYKTVGDIVYYAKKRGYPEAKFLLGKLYLDGDKLGKNIKQAKYWFEKSAAEGSTEAWEQLKELS